jgi:hypothetical protein
LELPGLALLSRARADARSALLCTILAGVMLALLPAAAGAFAQPLSAPPGTPILVTSMTTAPAGYRLIPQQVERIAARYPEVIAELRRHPRLVPYVYTHSDGVWQVSWFTPAAGVHHTQHEMIQVYVDDTTAQVTQVWTGYQIAWTMARGYPGAFGRKVNSLVVWLPLCAMFVVPFLPVPWRRRAGGKRQWGWRVRPSLVHLDLLMLLGLSISLALFNHANLGLSVPLLYPFLLYLLVRMLLLGFGIGRPREPLRSLVPSAWLVVGLVFLLGFRIGLNVTDSNVIDVGFAGVIGANKVLYGDKLYGGWPADNAYGDTYGPINYDAYVPFNVIFGWSGVWDNLPAAHAAAIAFDLLTILGLFLLGRQIRGPTMGITLAYLWAAYPFTLFTLSSNSNDSLVALTLVVTLLVLRWAPARGVAAAFAGLTKFAPLALAPLFLRGAGPPPTRRLLAGYVIGFVLAFAAAMAPVVLTGDLGAFWRDTIQYQIGRPAPFSIWGIWGGSFTNASNSLSVEQHLAEGAMLAMAVGVMFVPRRRGIVEVAALGAAVMIAFELCLTYWFYLYIVWFFPLVIVALVGAHPARPGVAQRPPSGHRYLRTLESDPHAAVPSG